MHLRAKGPVFIPSRFQAEIEKMSKAALMDMAWDYAKQIAQDEWAEDATMDEFRKRRDIILTYRKRK